MMGHQRPDSGLNGVSADLQLGGGDHRLVGTRANVRLLSGKELRVYGESMLQVVDSQLRSLAEPDRAKMPGHFDAILVGSFNHGRELSAGDEVIDLVRSSAFRRPVI